MRLSMELSHDEIVALIADWLIGKQGQYATPKMTKDELKKRVALMVVHEDDGAEITARIEWRHDEPQPFITGPYR